MKKKNLYLFLAVALAFVFAGCSQDALMSEDSGTGANTSKDAVYMNVTVQLPVGAGGTRSNTTDESQSNDGNEVGKDYENSVSSLLLVLADKDNGFIGCAEKSEGAFKKGADGTLSAVQSISKSVLSSYYGDGGALTAAESKINVFVFCNPTLALKDALKNVSTGDKTWCDAVCSINEAPDGTCDNATIWGGANHKGGFLMSSFELAEKSMPTKFSDWDNFTSADKPFQFSGNNTSPSINNQGAIKVERSVARFDFKDGSNDGLGANTYQVVKDAGGSPVMNIQLIKMALVNMSKNFYYLRRVSDDGLGKSDDNNFTLCGNEHGATGGNSKANYVVDTDAQEKYNFTKEIGTADFYKNHFNFCLGNGGNTTWTIDPTARGQWYTSSIDDVLNGEDDNDDSWNNEKNKGDYKIWRYVTENTIPGVGKQQNGISTGIVFKGKMIVPKGVTGTLADAIQNAKGDPNNDPILYVYGNEIFVTWKEVRARALELGEGDPLYRAVFGNPTNKPVAEKAAGEGTNAVDAVYSNDDNSADYKWDQWKNMDSGNATKLTAFKDAARTALFTLYQSSNEGDGPGYYCYYFYWNRHNDNGNNGVMGPMEFAVVRNNVYKLAVTKINKLGHPRVTENDPDPEDPENPDEKGDVYLSVSVKVLPWVVRINNIEF